MKAALQTEAKTSLSARLAFTPTRSGLLQRKCACGGTPGPSGECEACRKKRLQRKGNGTGAETQNASTVPPIVHEVLRSPGQPLDAQTRAFMEPRFGHDFSTVRVHADGRAAQSAKAVNALAYTVGSNIVFSIGRYAPDVAAGRQLLAHEPEHVVQQNSHAGMTLDTLGIGSADDAGEQQADRLARRVTFGNASGCARE